MAKELGEETWFTLGDRDIGLHLVRTRLLRSGLPLSEAMKHVADALGVRVRLLPVTDDPLRTKIVTDEGELDFQQWFVARRHADPCAGALRRRGRGASGARRARCDRRGRPRRDRAVEPVRVDPADPGGAGNRRGGRREARGRDLAARRRQGDSGPLAEMMTSLGYEASARGVAALYGELADVFVIDPQDQDVASDINGSFVCPIVMADPERRAEVGTRLLEALA